MSVPPLPLCWRQGLSATADSEASGVFPREHAGMVDACDAVFSFVSSWTPNKPGRLVQPAFPSEQFPLQSSYL